MANQKNSSSSFLFGLLLGAIIGAIIAIIIYKNKKSQVFDKFEKYFKAYLRKFTVMEGQPGSKTKPAKIIESVIVPDQPVLSKKPKPKMFVKVKT